MGIYGASHTGLDTMDFDTQSVPGIAKQLKKRYGDAVHSEHISWIASDAEPIRVDIITVNGKDYKATYFGEEDLKGFKDYDCREFWRLENAYDDSKTTGKQKMYCLIIITRCR